MVLELPVNWNGCLVGEKKKIISNMEEQPMKFASIDTLI